MISWDMVMLNIRRVPDESIIEPMFVAQISKSTILNIDILHYLCAKQPSARRTYGYLVDCV